MGHVPPGPLREAGQGDDVPRRQHRRDRQPLRRQGALAASHRRTVGALGEDIAVRFLEERGVSIVARNLRLRRDEVDVVAVDHGTRIVVEVKTAFRSTGFDPAENLDHRKAGTLRRAAAGLGIGRIDLITVVIDELGADVRWTRSVA